MLTKNEFMSLYGGNMSYNYMLLDRMRQDCEYVINVGKCDKSFFKYLWAVGRPEEHIQYMKYLWEIVPEKPEWLSWKEILVYEKKLVKNAKAN